MRCSNFTSKSCLCDPAVIQAVNQDADSAFNNGIGEIVGEGVQGLGLGLGGG